VSSIPDLAKRPGYGFGLNLENQFEKGKGIGVDVKENVRKKEGNKSQCRESGSEIICMLGSVTISVIELRIWIWIQI
jgi:hypothetical protein